MTDREFGLIIQRAAADQWLKAAPGTPVSTAAIHRPSRLSSWGCPTE